MPKVTWMNRSPPKVNHLAALFRAYRKASGMTSTTIAAKLGCTADNARRNMNKPGRCWTVGDLCKYCDVLSIPYEEAFAAAAK